MLDGLGRLPRDEVSIHTGSGPVRARVHDGRDGERRVEISRPRAASTPSPTRAETFNALSPDFARVRGVCDQNGSTGSYPYVLVDRDDRVFEARQFPRSSGYPEDAATGIAASALTFAGPALGLLDASTRPVRVRRGRAMGRLSEITVALDVVAGQVAGCWLGGPVRADT